MQDYQSVIKPVWCPGCGDYGVLKAVHQALFELDIPPEDVLAVSGIGCSGRMSHYINSYSLHGTHGRAVPLALGAKAARPELCVLAMGGDGDGLGIGGGHISHAARKNVDMTYILVDNRIYGLTKGQASPTTPVGLKTKTSPLGVFEDPLNAMMIFVAYGISFVARGFSLQVSELRDLISRAIRHRGFSVVYVLSPCKTFPALSARDLKERIKPLPLQHDVGDRMAAMKLADDLETLYTGVFYEVEKPTLENRLQHEIEEACRYNRTGSPCSTEEILESFA